MCSNAIVVEGESFVDCVKGIWPSLLRPGDRTKERTLPLLHQWRHQIKVQKRFGTPFFHALRTLRDAGRASKTVLVAKRQLSLPPSLFPSHIDGA